MSAASHGELTAAVSAPELNTWMNRTCNAQLIKQLLIFKVTLTSSIQEKAELHSYTRTSLYSKELDTVRLGFVGLLFFFSEGPVATDSGLEVVSGAHES